MIHRFARLALVALFGTGFLVTGLAATVGCGSKSSAKSADDAPSLAKKDKGGAAPSIEAGARVCIDGHLGQRYLVEDALSEQELEPVDDCMSADVMVQEQGEPGAYVLRYQMVGAGEWSSCESALEDHIAFLSACAGELIGGGGEVASAE
ncbi:MAG: hypothetical protein KC731_36690 [Myxococcales bacterium]|nr:hypothetical protein [Myxococcales bacterium]